MKFFYKLEQKYRRFGIHNLMYYIVIMYAAGLILDMFLPGFYIRYLSLNMSAVFHGQIWRLVTFMVCPPFGITGGLGSYGMGTVIFNFFALYLYYSIGQTLERVWGSFRFNVYFFMGVIGHIAAALIAYLAFGQILLLTTTYLNFSLFFAFAATFPDMEFLLMFVLPVKAKWLALFDGVYFLYSFINGNIVDRWAIVMSLANFIIFFVMTRNYSKISPREIKRKHNFKTQVKIMPQGESHHRCAVCGRTEKDGDELEFRYCSKCEGNYEYCQDHLYTHQHVTREKQVNNIND